VRTASERRDIAAALDELLEPTESTQMRPNAHPVDVLDRALARRGWQIVPVGPRLPAMLELSEDDIEVLGVLDAEDIAIWSSFERERRITR